MEKQAFTNMKDFKRAERRAKFKESIKKAAQWSWEHKEVLAILVPAAATVSAAGIKAATKHHTIAQENKHRNRTIYDHKLGGWWDVNRDLQNADRLEIERRKRAGEDMGQILKAMNLI